MAPKPVQTTDELLRDLLTVQLAVAGVPGAKIREIVGCSMDRVTRIVKHLKKPKDKK
jgi:hypothetical protein